MRERRSLPMGGRRHSPVGGAALPLLALLACATAREAHALQPYEGVWSDNKRTCRRDVDGVERMTIQGNRFFWYESRCEARTVARSVGAWTFRMACEGEGETWRTTTRMSLTAKGNLVLEDAPVGPTKRQEYVRCR